MTAAEQEVGDGRGTVGIWGELVLAVLSQAWGSGGIRIKPRLPVFMRNPIRVVPGRFQGWSAWCG
jgi:hypothetical protein